MHQDEHRTGVSLANLVVRHLKLEPADDDKLNAAIQEIDQLYGLDGVSFDYKSQVLNLAYDAARLNIDDIEELLKKYNLQISHHWWTRFKKNHYAFVDQNVKDNAKAEPHCCNKLPPEAKR